LACYTIDELRHIANMSIELEKAIELYNIAQQQLILKDRTLFAKEQVIISKDSVIVSMGSVISLKEGIIVGKNHEITDLRTALSKTNRLIKWLKIQKAGLTIGLSGLVVYCLFK